MTTKTTQKPAQKSALEFRQPITFALG